VAGVEAQALQHGLQVVRGPAPEEGGQGLLEGVLLLAERQGEVRDEVSHGAPRRGGFFGIKAGTRIIRSGAPAA